jgi:hypothetical protein
LLVENLPVGDSDTAHHRACRQTHKRGVSYAVFKTNKEMPIACRRAEVGTMSCFTNFLCLGVVFLAAELLAQTDEGINRERGAVNRRES